MNAPTLLGHLNQTQLARRWCLSPRTLERWRWLKQGPDYVKVGGRVLYRLDDIELFEAANLRHLVSKPSVRDLERGGGR
jgi:hypothetical protein